MFKMGSILYGRTLYQAFPKPPESQAIVFLSPEVVLGCFFGKVLLQTKVDPQNVYMEF